MASSATAAACPPSAPPIRVAHPVAKKIRAAATSTSAWAAWIASTPAKARHHQRATPSVCGKAWHASASGAIAISSTVSISRAT